jgi:CBS domain-containing protein
LRDGERFAQEEARMQVADVMTPRAHFVTAESTLRETAKAMKAWSVGFLPVRRGEQLVGVVTDRDLALRPALAGRSYDATRVGEIMSSHAHAVRASDSVEGAARAMIAKRVRRLLVLDAASRLVGVLSVSDIAARGRDAALPGRLLRALCGPRRSIASSSRR